MAKDPAFSFYAQDFILDTVQWTRAAKGLHCELLSIAWINGYIEANEAGEPVEMDEDGIRLWNARVRHKWILQNGRLYNNRLEETREKRKNFKESQSEKGKASARKRATEPQPEVNHGSTTVQPGIPVEPSEREYEKEKELENGNENYLVPRIVEVFKKHNPNYPAEKYLDEQAAFSIAKFLCQQGKLMGPPEQNAEPILDAWESICLVIMADKFYCQKSLKTIANSIQEIIQKALHGDQSKADKSGKPGLSDDKLKAALSKRANQ